MEKVGDEKKGFTEIGHDQKGLRMKSSSYSKRKRKELSIKKNQRGLKRKNNVI